MSDHIKSDHPTTPEPENAELAAHELDRVSGGGANFNDMPITKTTDVSSPK
jgi:hypothetical protein